MGDDAYTTQIEQSSASRLVPLVKRALAAACLEQSGIEPGVLAMPGMSGRRYRHFANNLIRTVPDPRYLEVGSWAGSTLCAAISRNRVRATAVDNWSQFGGPKVEFEANLGRYRGEGAEVSFVESDFRHLNYAGMGPFNVYLFDGPHEFRDQFDAVYLVQDALDEEFVFVVDDWNLRQVRDGTLQALAAAGMAPVFSVEIRTTLDETHGTPWGQHGEWHNGYYIAVVRKAAS